MNPKAFFWLITAILLAFFYRAEAQQPGRVPRIGFLTVSSASALAARIDAFRQGLRELGDLEGKNILIEWRSAEGKPDRIPTLAAELVRLKVDLFVTGGPQSTRPAREATSTIPIVMAFDNDPVGNGFVATLARPGGNITGLSTLAPELNGKQLELLKEIVPRLSRVAILGDSTIPGNVQALKEIEPAAGALTVKILHLDIQTPKDLDSVFRAASKERADAVLVLTSPVFNPYRKETAGVAAKHRLPTIYSTPEFVEDGGLMSYSVSFTDLYRRAASDVDKILKGAKPANLPVEQPPKFDLIINLNAAKQIGLTIPPNVLARADG
jgi:putative ABC transport system substrate-binding protein